MIIWQQQLEERYENSDSQTCGVYNKKKEDKVKLASKSTPGTCSVAGKGQDTGHGLSTSHPEASQPW